MWLCLTVAMKHTASPLTAQVPYDVYWLSAISVMYIADTFLFNRPLFWSARRAIRVVKRALINRCLITKLMIDYESE